MFFSVSISSFYGIHQLLLIANSPTYLYLWNYDKIVWLHSTRMCYTCFYEENVMDKIFLKLLYFKSKDIE